MKMIGSQVSIQACMSSQSELPASPSSCRSGSSRNASVPSEREIVRVAVSSFQPSGTSAPGSRSTSRISSLASSQVISDVSSTVSLYGPGWRVRPASCWLRATSNGTMQAAEPPSAAAGAAETANAASAASRGSVRRVLLIQYPNRPSVPWT
jgi:hypothetical protein